MRCLIAGLLVEIPAAGGVPSRCGEYLTTEIGTPDIIIDSSQYRPEVWPFSDEAMLCYMESGVQFYENLLYYNGLMLHASAVELDGKAYLFSGPCGMGKSTHTRLWQQVFGDAAQVFNDDKPALRKIDNVWYAYGTPWCGKDGINQNKKVPLAGICFLKQAMANRIICLNTSESIRKIISQTRKKLRDVEKLDLMIQNVGQLVQDIPIFELENRPEPDAVILSYETMLKAAQERNL